jgi:hypothetical protein
VSRFIDQWLSAVQLLEFLDALSGNCLIVNIIHRETLTIDLISQRSRHQESNVCHPVAARRFTINPQDSSNSTCISNRNARRNRSER